MSFENYKNLWVLIETEENTAKNVGYELLTPGRQLADKLGEELVAVVIGGQVEDVAQKGHCVWRRQSHSGGRRRILSVFVRRLHLCTGGTDP